MKAITFLIFAIFFAFTTKAQEWQTYYEDQGVTIQYRLVEIDDPQLGIHHARIVFHYENKTSNEIQLNFIRTISYTDSETAKPQEKVFSVSIPANSSIEYNQANSMDKTYYLFAQDKKNRIKKSLISFDIKEITIL
jgi:hypothetical protein